MWIYWCVFFAALILSLLSLDRQFKANNLRPLIPLLFILFVGLRYASTDYFSYLRLYNDVTSFADLGFTYTAGNTPVEFSFALLVLIEKVLWGNFEIFILIFAFISISIKFAAFKELSPFFFFTLLLYVTDEYLFKDLGQMRNAMASGIVLYGVKYVHERSFWKFFAAILFAISNHSMAIVALPLYWVKCFSSRLLMLMGVIVGILLGFLGGFGKYLPLLFLAYGAEDSRIVTKFGGVNGMEGNLVSGTVVFQLFFCLIFLMCKSHVQKKNKYSSILIPMFVWGCVGTFICKDFAIVSSRIREMLCIPSFAVLAPSLILIPKGRQKFIAAFIIVAYAALYFFALMQNIQNPYQIILLK